MSSLRRAHSKKCGKENDGKSTQGNGTLEKLETAHPIFSGSALFLLSRVQGNLCSYTLSSVLRRDVSEYGSKWIKTSLYVNRDLP